MQLDLDTIKQACEALRGDSNDAEHDALSAVVDAVGIDPYAGYKYDDETGTYVPEKG